MPKKPFHPFSVTNEFLMENIQILPQKYKYMILELLEKRQVWKIKKKKV